MSITCQYTVMAPPATTTSTHMPSRLARRRNAMANVMDGMSAAEIDHIRVQAPANINTARGTCISSPTTSPSHRSTSTSSDDTSMTGSSDDMTLAALAFSPADLLLSPSLRRRRNALADALADIDESSLMRMRAAHQSSQHDSEHDSTGVFPTL